MSFGNENVGTTSSAQTVTVTNPGTTAASMSSIGVTGPFAQTNTCGTSLAAGASCTVSVTFAPTAAGAATGTPVGHQQRPEQPADRGAVRHRGHHEHQPGPERPGHRVELHPGVRAVQRHRRQHQHLLGSEQRRLAQHDHREPGIGPDPRLDHRRPPAVLGLVRPEPRPCRSSALPTAPASARWSPPPPTPGTRPPATPSPSRSRPAPATSTWSSATPPTTSRTAPRPPRS